MSTPTVELQRKAIAVLKLPGSNDKLIIYLNDIFAKMSADTRYSGSAAKLTLFDGEIKDFLKMQIAYKSKPPTKSKENRDDAKDKACLTANSLKRDVQELAEGNPSEAEAIITGANMSVKIIKVRQKQQNSYLWGTEPGTLVFYAAGKGSHEWQSSQDGKTWNNDGATGIAKKTYDKEAASKINYSRNRQILTKGRYGEWSNPIVIDRH
jgi:hypothetical protein